MSKEPVYISYSRKDEEKHKTIEKMQTSLYGIDFKIDTKEVGVRDNFNDFIHEIGQAKHIIVVFSERYFKSFYCMYELLKIIQFGGQLKDRVFLIRDEKYLLNNVNHQQQIKEYWKKVVDSNGNRTEELTKHGTQQEVEDVTDRLERIIKLFSEVNGATINELKFPFGGSLFDDSYQAIWQWLRATKAEMVLDAKKQTDDSVFIIKVEDELVKIFKGNPVLYQNIKKIYTKIKDEKGLAKMLCGIDDQVVVFEESFMLACKDAVEQTQTKSKIDNLKLGILKLLNHLCIMAINPNWLIYNKNQQGVLVEIPAQTTFGAAIAAGRCAQVIPSLSVDQDENVINKYELSPFKTISWDNTNGAVIGAILRFIYNSVMDTPQLKNKIDPVGAINKSERIKLNREIKLNASVEKKHYYCMLRKHETASAFINAPELISELKKELPALDIFIVKTDRGDDLFMAVDEDELSQTYYHFLTNLKEW